MCPSNMVVGLVPPMVRYKCRAFLWMVVGVSYHVGGSKCREFPQMVVGVSYHAGGCKCWGLSLDGSKCVLP